MKKALKIGIMGMIGFMLFVYGGLSGYCLAWSRMIFCSLALALQPELTLCTL